MVSGCVGRYPDEEVGEVSMEFIAKKPTGNLSANKNVVYISNFFNTKNLSWSCLLSQYVQEQFLSMPWPFPAFKTPPISL